MANLRYAVEVMAGLIPGRPDPEFTKRFLVTSKEWADESGNGSHAVSNESSPWAEAVAYAATLVDPSRVNWVKVEWVWF